MYEVKSTGEIFKSFMEACKAGKAANSEVYEVNTGIRRWYPVECVSEKNKRYFAERLAAYEAQQAAKKSFK